MFWGTRWLGWALAVNTHFCYLYMPKIETGMKAIGERDEAILE